jgi:4-hydroxy-4-methyl-2-oxoglutarate aldolase
VIHTQIHRIDPELITTLARCGVATVAEAMGPVLGIEQTMAERMYRRTTRMGIAGPAITAANGLSDNLMMHAALRVADEGDVLVISCGSSPGAQWGELVAHAAAARGIAGAVMDGAVRDVDAIEALGFPVWASAVAPLGARKEVLGWVNRPTVCGGVRVDPGDIVVADGDGVVVVPRRQVDSVVAAAVERAEREERTREAARQGQLPGDLSGLYERLDASGIEVIDSPWEPV